MNKKSKELNRIKEASRQKTVNKLKLYLGWFGLLTPVFGAGVLVGVGLLGTLSGMFVAGVVVASSVNYFAGRMLLRPVSAIRGKKKVRYA